jgi:hypothetical protein
VLFVIVLQYSIAVDNGNAANLTFAESTIRFLSYFTVEVYILVGLVLLSFAIRPKFDEWTVHPFVRSAIASYIAVGGFGSINSRRPTNIG